MESFRLEARELINAIKPLGRVQNLSCGIGCDHSGTGFELSAVFESDLQIEFYITKEKDGCDSAYFTVYIDGKRIDKRYEVAIGSNALSIEIPKDKNAHVLRVVKQSESNYNLCEIRAISFVGKLLPPPEKKAKYVEYIGDSLSCGMGLLGKKGVEWPQTSRWEDVTRGYTYMSAQEFDADYSIISESGIGLAGSWFDPLFDFYSAWSYKRDKELKYDFARVPDLLIINLGTNDFYLNCDLGICSLEAVEEKTVEFIEFVRGSYGRQIPVLWVSRFMRVGNSYVDAIDKAIAKMGGEDAKIFRLDVPTCAGGAQGHPDIEGHKVACECVVNYVREKNLI